MYYYYYYFNLPPFLCLDMIEVYLTLNLLHFQIHTEPSDQWVYVSHAALRYLYYKVLTAIFYVSINLWVQYIPWRDHSLM